MRDKRWLLQVANSREIYWPIGYRVIPLTMTTCFRLLTYWLPFCSILGIAPSPHGGSILMIYFYTLYDKILKPTCLSCSLLEPSSSSSVKVSARVIKVCLT